MAGNGGSRRRPAPRRAASGVKRAPGAKKTVAAKKKPPAPGPVSQADEAPRTFTLGLVPGTTPGKWISAWRERMPRVELALLPLAVADQHDALREHRVDAALVRLPLDDDDLHIVRLYDEVPVAIVPADSHLTAADELELADLAGEIVIVPGDDVLSASVPGAVAPAFAPPAVTEQAVETVAAGVGVVLVPMSLARLHARKDVAARPVRDAPVSTVALAWPREATTADVDAFVGIVRGRTANSSR
ncbi:LysR substrate-binding domain-containing protein [Microbacterium sp. A1-JK]|uniref:LysR substrate-binding domain-containing protein n=1 Tax=Microbacterium sp. A1-JK TaxID=3177516 RepID=UPI0038890D96